MIETSSRSIGEARSDSPVLPGDDGDFTQLAERFQDLSTLTTMTTQVDVDMFEGRRDREESLKEWLEDLELTITFNPQLQEEEKDWI